MERTVGREVLVAVAAMILMLWPFASVCASSKLTKFNDHEEKLRRNLLANGLGVTPPMGYVM